MFLTRLTRVAAILLASATVIGYEAASPTAARNDGATVATRSAAPDVDVATSQRLADAAQKGRAFEYVRDLTATIGGRLTATASYQRATHWVADRLRDAGVSSVALDPFTMPRGWERAGPAVGRILSPVQQPIAIQSLGWSPSTPGGSVEGELVLIGEHERLSADRVRNRIVMADGAVRLDAELELKRAGALALLFPDSDPENEIAARVRQFGGELTALPSALVARDDVAVIRRLMARRPVRVAVALPNATSDGPVTAHNVIAEIAGRERPDEWVLVGAHLDSWDLATGAQDNGSGVAMVLEAARAIAALERRPRRSIRFALWGGEEQGLLGSAAYAAAHERELDQAVAVLNADGGTGRILGWTTPGRDDVMAKVRQLAATALAGLNATMVDRSMRYAFDSDGGPFVRRGVPVLDLNVDDSRYEDIHHKATDTLERVDARNLAIGAATVAVTAYMIADDAERLARRGPVLRRP